MNIKILKILAISSFLLCCLYFVRDANLPFVGPFGNNNSTYSIQAKNYLKLGFWSTKFAPVNKIENGKPQYYLHHPPLLQLLTALSYEIFGKIFGQNQAWPGRFFPIVSTLVSIIFIALIAKNLWGSATGWLALFLGSTSPFLLSFGKIIQFEPLLLATTLIFVFLTGKNKSKKISFLLALLAVVGSLIDWLMIIFLTFFYLLNRKRLHNLQIYLFLSFMTLILFFTYSSWLSGPKELISAFFGRSLGGELFGKNFFSVKFILLQLIRIIVYFTPLGFISAVYFLRRKEKNKIVSVFLFFGVANVILFLNGAYAHPYWLYYLTPFFILMSANLLTAMLKNKKWFWPGVFFLIINIFFSIIIINFKDQQVKKALWQDKFIDQTAEFLSSGEEIGTSWDFNEELFRYKTGHPITILWSKDEIFSDTVESPKWRYFIFSCWANCTSEDAKISEILINKFSIALTEKEGRAVLFDLSKPQNQTSTTNFSNNIQTPATSKSVLFYYRKLRDILGVNQI